MAAEIGTVIAAVSPWVMLVGGMVLLGVVGPFFVRMLRGRSSGDSTSGGPGVGVAVGGNGFHAARMRGTSASAVGGGRFGRRGGGGRGSSGVPRQRVANPVAVNNRNALTTKIRAEHLRRQDQAAIESGGDRRQVLDARWAAWHDDPYMTRSGAPEGHSAPKERRGRKSRV